MDIILGARCHILKYGVVSPLRVFLSRNLDKDKAVVRSPAWLWLGGSGYFVVP